jgi:hypothetical protein
MLGDLYLSPGDEIGLDTSVGNCPVVSTANAVLVWRGGFNQPTASVELRIGAKPLKLSGHRQRPPNVLLPLQCGERHKLRNEAETTRALFASGVLEIEKLPAMLALEKLHCPLNFPVAAFLVKARNKPVECPRQATQWREFRS